MKIGANIKMCFIYFSFITAVNDTTLMMKMIQKS